MELVGWLRCSSFGLHLFLYYSIMEKVVVVLGASENPGRYSYMAVNRLLEHDYTPVAIGKRRGNIGSVEILDSIPSLEHIYAVSIYLNRTNQGTYFDFILNSNVQKVIFNPGAENRELMELCIRNNILSEEACTLVQLSMGIF